MENYQPTENQGIQNPTPPTTPVQPIQASVVGIGDWILTLIIMIIPLVNIIMLFVWAFGAGTNHSKANWAKASLILMLIGIILGVVMFGAIASFIATVF